MQGRIHIGTSGFHYPHWQDVFYPPGLGSADWLAFYMEHFSTVEINNTFYRLPTVTTFKAWERAAAKGGIDGFVYALKASRYITHMKKLKDAETPLMRFMQRAALLKKNLGPVLFQLPPRFRCNTDRLEQFTKLLSQGTQGRRFVFEFRDPSWFNEEVYEILRAGAIGLCVYDMPEFESPDVVTGDFVYLRFHGTGTLYNGRYSKKSLLDRASRIKEHAEEGRDVYAYFNNDALGNAVINARELKEMVG